MSAETGLDVKVIFDASARGRRRLGASRRRSRTGVWIVLGLVNLAAAGAAYAFTWWKADPFIYMTFMLRTPVPGLSVGDVDRAFAGMRGVSSSATATPSSSASESPSPAASAGPKITGDRARNIIAATSLSWLTIATVASCALALAAGSLFGRAGGAPIRRAGAILLIVTVLLLAFGTFRTLSEYGMHYLPWHLRTGMGGLVGLAFLLGVTIGSRTRGFCRLAGVVTILGGVATAAALYLGHLCGAIEPPYATPGFLAMTLIGVSAWGWLLFPLSTRWAR